MRLFCLPFAGGSASAFHGWGERMSPHIEVWAAQPRGRGMRFKDAPRSTIALMAEDYLSVLRSNLELPFAFYGHSLGGLLSFEIARLLEQEGLPLPGCLFLGACAPPTLGLLHAEIRHLPDSTFLTTIQQRYGGIPEAVMNEPELLEIFLPALRAEYSAHETYDRREAVKVGSPIHAFAGIEDSELRPEQMGEWAVHTRSRFQLSVVAGSHFFLDTSSEQVLAEIRSTFNL